MYIILTPNEYYTVLPALAINAASNKPDLPQQLRTLHLLSNGIYIAQYSIYTVALFYHDCTELKKKFHFIFQASIVLKSLILLFVHLISLCCPVLFQARPIDSLNRTSYNNCQQKIIHSARGICADAYI